MEGTGKSYNGSLGRVAKSVGHWRHRAGLKAPLSRLLAG